MFRLTLLHFDELRLFLKWLPLSHCGRELLADSDEMIELPILDRSNFVKQWAKVCIKNDGSYIKHDEICIKNDKCCIKSDGFRIQNDECCIKSDELFI